MLFIKYLSILIIASNLFEVSFRESSVDYDTSITNISNTYKLTFTTKTKDSILHKDFINFTCSVYNLQVCDINGDGVNDFCIGLIKPTRWNKQPHPVLHIYSHQNEKLYPLWRSSKIGKNLVDFEIDSTANIPGIKILENPDKHVYNIALYRWKSFGLKFVQYLYKNLDSLTSAQIFRGMK